MDVKVNNQGDLVIDIKDLLQHLDDEQAESLIQGLAWDTRTWNVIKEAVKNEHAAFSYNEDLLKLRIAFLTEWDNDFDNPYRRVADVVDALLTEIDKQRNAARNADKAYWKIYHLMKDIARKHGIQLPGTEYTGLNFFHAPAKEIAEKYMPEIERKQEE